jgi:predicted RNase H-like HicB family nuclease
MTTMIAAYNSDGCIGRCDAKCYNAEHPHCDCVCGGANHGAGINQATQNTQELAEKWIEEYQKRRGETLDFDVLPKPVQLALL